MKKDLLKTGHIYHIFNKSIAGYKIFNAETSLRFIQILTHYNNTTTPRRLAYELKTGPILNTQILFPHNNQIVKYISYCIMPTHYHLLIKVVKEENIYHFLNTLGNSYTRYFNILLKRKGPLWQSSFQAVRVKTNEQLLHVSRYIHLNPTTSDLVKNPEDWKFSSYAQFITNKQILQSIMKEITIKSSLKYKKFVESRIDYQKKLKVIRNLILE